jgi:ABC-type sugar transport system permease subunit
LWPANLRAENVGTHQYSDGMSEATPHPAGIRPTMMAPPARKPTWHVVVGLLLALPALVLLIVSYVEPTIWTVRASFHKVEILRSRGGIGAISGDITTDNYTAMLERGLLGTFGFALSLAIVPILVVLIAAPALAWAAHLGGTAARWITRGLLALPLAAYAPTAIAVAHFAEIRRFQPEEAAGVIRGSFWLGGFGLVAALAATWFLAALRRRDPRRSPWPALIVAGGIALAATLAAALQEFTYPYVFSRGLRGSSTPLTSMFTQGFIQFRFGEAATYSTILLALLMLLGLAVTIVVIVTGLRLEFDDTRRSADEATRASGTQVAGIVIAGVIVLTATVITLIGIGPTIGKIFGGYTGELPASAGTIQANTWLPPLVSTLVGVLVAAAAAFGISWLRPLGRHSEWLLVPFGLFLFVGIGPLALRKYASGSVAGRINSFWGLVPPTWVALPVLFALALLLRGQALRAATLAQLGQRLSTARQLVPVLPFVALAFLVTVVVHAQDLLWPLLSATAPEKGSGPVVLIYIMGSRLVSPDDLPYNLVLPIAVFVLGLLVVIASQLLYVDRLALRLGRPERAEPPRT